ncbi:MAG: CO dehydrogenase/CO-methylating acetyl-CoA synthase complex subunit beta [Thermoplasmatales archaeon]|nr:CO dehydrogenase/CO-methylating acetyl-CoA synthase complex subunit beta [Thermoplasmatales archaeon]
MGGLEERYGVGADGIAYLSETVTAADVPGLLAFAADGADAAVSLAIECLVNAIGEFGGETIMEYPETGYGLPLITGWKGIEGLTLSGALEFLRSLPKTAADGLEGGMEAGEKAMYSCEILEAVAYLRGHGGGFVPDRVIRELGLVLVDETIPGAAVFLGGELGDPTLPDTVRDLQSKGMLGLVAGEYSRAMEAAGIRMGLDRMLYPLGDFAGLVHALNFAVRAALIFGGVTPGDKTRLGKYLAKRPKVVVLQTGPISKLEAALAFAALLHGAAIVTDIDLPEIPKAIKVCKDRSDMLQVGIEERGINVRLEPLDLPVGYGPAFEGEIIRKPDTYVEAGGSRSRSFEILLSVGEGEVEDGKVEVVGPEIDGIAEGSAIPLAMVVKVYGAGMHGDLEPVLERRFHQSINYAEGVWHTGQRSSNWVRVSKFAKEKGFKFRDLGRALIHGIRREFSAVATRVQATIITDPAEMGEIARIAEESYAARDERMRGLKDESVGNFYTCTMCQSFAPGHICIISPERVGLCGAINWLDAKASNELAPKGPNAPVPKGEPVDAVKGVWDGINDLVRAASMGSVEKICMYSFMDSPMTSCGCFEVVVGMTVDMQGVVLVDRDFQGMTPLGMKFSTLAGSIGGGRQTPGFMGIGKKYIMSDKFISAEGGLPRVAWMPSGLKRALGPELAERCAEIGYPDLPSQIADETVTTEAEGLMEWMAEVGHPALGMDPLM